MKSQEIQKHINRIVGTEGILRIPSWWMRKILTDIVKFCEEKEDNDALDYFKSYVNKQLTILDNQDSILSNKLDNTNSRVSALESKQLFVILNSLPEKGVENKIYLIPNLNGEDKNVLTEWAWINETWEQFGEFKPEIDLTPYLKISDSPFEKGSAENSAVLKGGNNDVTSEFEVALGTYNKSNSDTRFSIGIGTSDTDRKNAVEVKKNGDIYIEGVEGRIQDKLDKLVNITYEELKSLRDNSQLVSGQQYRITDYVTTTAQENTRSAGHQFDVIVTADDVKTLNEEARVIVHDGDTYFTEAGANLAAWKIWYNLDNDTDRFAWANNEVDYTIHVPVSDYTKEWLWRSSVSENISIPDTLIFTWWDNSRNGPDGYGLDFYKATNIRLGGDDALMIAFTCGTIPQSGVEFNEIILTSYGEEQLGNHFYYNAHPTDVIIDTLPTVINKSIGKGVIYRMIDEWNNDCPYDFKNIQFARWELSNPVGYRNYEDNWIQEFTPFNIKPGFYGINGTTTLFTYGYDLYKVEYTISTEPTYCYTFGKDADYSMSDNTYNNRYNVIKEYKSDNKIRLNNIVFLSDACYSNSFGYGCCDSTFGGYCNNNIFGDYCSDNSFGSSCYHNNFGGQIYSCSFGNYCQYNSFGNNCNRNSFSNTCQYNSFGTNCSNNCFDRGLFNKFNNGCSNNSFGRNFASNSFGNNCQYNSFGEYCQSNSFGNSCSYNSFRSSSSKTATLLNYCSYNHFDDGCSYNVIWNSDTTGSSNKLQNINVNRGVYGTSSNYNFINVNTLNTGYEIKVAKNPAGEIKIYCEADLIV